MPRRVLGLGLRLGLLCWPGVGLGFGLESGQGLGAGLCSKLIAKLSLISDISFGLLKLTLGSKLGLG